MPDTIHLTEAQYDALVKVDSTPVVASTSSRRQGMSYLGTLREMAHVWAEVRRAAQEVNRLQKEDEVLSKWARLLEEDII
jgi:hypothetical protein